MHRQCGSLHSHKNLGVMFFSYKNPQKNCWISRLSGTRTPKKIELQGYIQGRKTLTTYETFYYNQRHSVMHCGIPTQGCRPLLEC